MNNKPIGIIDSGIGSFSTCIEIIKALPNESMIVYTDLAHMPYGEKSSEFLIARALAIIEYLKSLEVKLIIIACNTLSTVWLSAQHVFAHISVPVFNVIKSSTEYLYKYSVSPKSFTVLGTHFTISNRIYSQLIKQSFPEIPCQEIATREWAGLIEKDSLESQELIFSIKHYIEKLEDHPNHIILLACTHYYFIEDKIKSLMPNSQIFNTSTPIVQDIKEFLIIKNLISDKAPNYSIQTSKTTSVSEQMAKVIFGDNVPITVKELL